MEYRTSAAVQELNPSHGADFRVALGRFASGVTVVTGVSPAGEPVGMTCQSFASVSLDPPLVMFLPSRTSTTFPALREAGSICINVLAQDQDWLSNQFAVKGGDKWAGVTWTPGSNSAPRLDGAVLWCEGAIHEVRDAGDHHVVIVGVEALATPFDPDPPLIFHQGRYGRIGA